MSRGGSKGEPIGEARLGAKLNRRLVDTILELHEEHGLGARRVKAYLWEWHGVAVSLNCIHKIFHYQTWSTTVVDTLRD